MRATLALPEVAADAGNEAGLLSWRFVNRLQYGRINDEQTARVLAFFDEMKAKYPEAAEEFDNHRFVAQYLTPGNVAPNILGTDTNGEEFELEEYRGKIVAIVFTGQWCGPCRSEYPYQRALLDIYDEEDVVLLGVNSDALLETAVQSKEDEGLHYRTWWDGHSQPDADVVAAEGPIATEWGVSGWPTIYVLDEEGVVRYVNRRKGGMLAAIDELVLEKQMREWEEEQAAGEDSEEGADEDGGDGETAEPSEDGEDVGDDGDVGEG